MDTYTNILIYKKARKQKLHKNNMQLPPILAD